MQSELPYKYSYINNSYSYNMSLNDKNIFPSLFYYNNLE